MVYMFPRSTPEEGPSCEAGGEGGRPHPLELPADELLRAIEELVRDAYRDGFQAGYADALGQEEPQ